MIAGLVGTSASKILSILQNKSATQRELIILTGLSERAVRNNLNLLKELGLISESYDSRDLRFKRYRLIEHDAMTQMKGGVKNGTS